MIDAIVQLTVLDRDLPAPPASPSEGSRYIVAPGASGPWAGQSLRIAAWQDGGWAFFAPLEGWIAWIADEDVAVVWSGTGWIALGGVSSVNPVPLVGINTTADITNRLAVAAPATLLNHAGAGHQLKVNKAAVTDTASLLFQDAFSGRAEMGLAGDDNFHLKISADGTTWKEAMMVDRMTGIVSLPFTPLAVTPNLLINGDFQINQRGYAGAGLSAGLYGPDRWKGGTAGGAALSIAGYVVTLGAAAIEQVIEPSAMSGVSNLASTALTVSLDAPTANIAVTLGSAMGTIVGGSGRRSVTLTTASADTGNLMLRLASAAGGAVSFGRVKIEIGASATPWQPRAGTTEFQLAARYFQKSYATLIAPGTITDEGMIEHRDTRASQGGKDMFNTRLAAPMRAAPALRWYSNVTGALGFVRAIHTGAGDQTVAQTIGASSVSSGYPAGFAIANAVGDLWRGHFTADAEI
jgi:Protein of unknown function (DUF2793)